MVPAVLKIHEFIAESGSLSSVYLRRNADALELCDDDGALPLPPGALEAVMRRYGSPFDPDAKSQEQGVLELGHEHRLRHVRHLAGYDVIARDYLVYEAPGAAPSCVMATNVAGALRHLALAARRAT